MKDNLFISLFLSNYRSKRAHIYQCPEYIDFAIKDIAVPLCGQFNVSVAAHLLADIKTGVPLNDNSLVRLGVCKNCLRVRERLLQKMGGA